MGRAGVSTVKRSRVTMDVDQLRLVCGYAHWIPITQGLYKEFFAANYSGWEWNDFVPKLWKKGIIVSDVRDSDFIRLSQGLFVAPDVESIDFIPDKRGVRVVVHYVKEVSTHV